MIRLEEVTKKFGDFTAVDGVTLSVGKGEIYGLLGANGAGKTTLIRMMCGILSPTSGKGTVMGWDISREQSRIQERIGYMSQKFSLYPDLTVEENLRFYADLYHIQGHVKKRVAEVLAEWNLTEWRSTRVSALAGGWRQRVAFASATLHAPPLLFLDEPTSGADPATRRAFWDGLYRLAEGGTTILVTTHYMDEAERCDRVAMMLRGKVAAEGRVTDLRREYAGVLNKPRPTLEEIFHHIIRGRGEKHGQKLG
ncbi:ABC transporter ATP-binding protein [Marinithermofilum abyssi]|uniref:ABC transporter ATP-binding protein n=1 Tax=Marinithermofilum abyssi TaxID=1571185 RepID=A0A8J2Y9I1_9BACL|nr:ABC transporter ATP-binding protein [Marinithermofilum abyssi]GGE23299.1 ABC transporter ATP-binding protein [Marinithermofilum abyssi]